MPTDEEIIQGLIDGIEQQSEKNYHGTHIDQKGGAAVADTNSYIDLTDANIENTSVNIETNIISPEDANEAIVYLEALQKEIKKENPDKSAIKQTYEWFDSNIPLVASTLSILESVKPVVLI